MTQRKGWTSKEDTCLKEIVNHRNITKWSTVARVLMTQYGVQRRSGKQCRERWHNKLDPRITSEEWAVSEEDTLFEKHKLLGNKWARIAQFLPGRSDNCVKNHFYSTVRKTFRKVNRYITNFKKRAQVRSFKNSVLNKIIFFAEEAFLGKTTLTPEQGQKCMDIQNTLLILARDTELLDREPHIIQKLIHDIAVVSKIPALKKARKKKKRLIQKVSDISEPARLDLSPSRNKSSQTLRSSPQLARLETAVSANTPAFSRNCSSLSFSPFVDSVGAPTAHYLITGMNPYPIYTDHALMLAGSMGLDGQTQNPSSAVFFMSPFSTGMMLDATLSYMSGVGGFTDRLQSSTQYQCQENLIEQRLEQDRQNGRQRHFEHDKAPAD